MRALALGDVLLAVDASPSNIGLVTGVWDCESPRMSWTNRAVETVEGIERLSACDTVRRIHELAPKTLWLLIEKPSGTYHGSQAVSAVARRVEAFARKEWPRKTQITFVDPRTWQGQILKGIAPMVGIGAPGGDKPDPKEISLWYARNVLMASPRNDHEADALCIDAYARANFRALFGGKS